MSLDGSESILCVTRRDLEKIRPWAGYRENLGTEVDQIDRASRWFPRTTPLEHDRNIVQLVAYSLVWDCDPLDNRDPCVLVYRRSSVSTEGRLHGKFSVGLGGHINKQDVRLGAGYDGLFWSVYRAMAREVKEELALESVQVSDPCHTLLFDSSWEGVEGHHFGLCGDAIVGRESFANHGPIEEGVEVVGWLSMANLRPFYKDHIDSFEKWSKVIIENRLLAE